MRAMKDFQPGRDTGSAGSAPADIDFEAEHRPEVSRRASNAALRRYVQKQAISGASLDATHEAAAKGVASPTTSLPFADQIQSSFGPSHDVSKINAHVGGDSASAMGANAYASGDHVVFDKSPDLHTAAHEAAHVVQQAQGVNLYGGVGEAGDSYERHADAVADRVVAGQSAADLLGPSGGSVGQSVVQKNPKTPVTLPDAATASSDEVAKVGATAATKDALLAALDLATKRVHGARHVVIDTISAPIDERGLEPQLEQFEKQYSIASSEVDRVWHEVSNKAAGQFAGQPAFRDQLLPLAEATQMFFQAYDRAKAYASAHGRDMFAKHNDEFVLENLRTMSTTLGVRYYETPPTQAEPNQKIAVGQLENTSFSNSLIALGETVAVIERLTASPIDEMKTYIARAVSHATEVEKLLPAISAAEMKKLASARATVVFTVEKLKDATANRAELKESTTYLTEQLARIVPRLK